MSRTFSMPPMRTRARRTVIFLFALSIISWVILPDSLRTQIQPEAQAASFTVNSLGDSPDASPGNGACADAGGQCTLRAAIQESNATFIADTINCSLAGTIDLNTALPAINFNTTIQGPGAGTLTVRRSTAGGTPNFRIFTINSGAVVSISGLTVTNGRTADGPVGGGGGTPGYGGTGENGGGILNNGSLTLTDVVVTNNRTGNGSPGTTGIGGVGGFGGGISSTGPLTLTNVAISNNTTGNGAEGYFGGWGGRGGAIYFFGSALTITNSSITGNRTGDGGNSTSGAASGDGGEAGGVYAEKGVLTLTGVLMDGNDAGDGYPTISSGGGDGGALYTHPAVQTIMTNCTVSNNNSGQGGSGFSAVGGLGGGIFNTGSLTIIASTISGNFTKGPSSGGFSHGGGIFNGNTLTIINSTISGNVAHAGGVARGGGIYNNASSISLTNVTITGNSAALGQGLHTNGTANIRNSIIADNGAPTSPDVSGSFNSQGHNLIGKADSQQSGLVHGVNGDQVGTPATPINPLLGPLANNGGPTLTHALQLNSPALDAGDDCVTQVAHCGDANIPRLTTDQRGATRPADSDDADAIATSDIGAFELHSAMENIPDKTTNEDTAITVSFSTGDLGPAVTSVSASTDNQALVPNGNIQVSGSGFVRSLLITPTANQSGTATITVTVNYSGGSSAIDTFLLTVTSVNDAPSFTKGPDQTVLEDAGAQSIVNWATGISAGPADESGQTLSFVTTGNSNPTLFSSAPTISGTGTLSYTPAANANGTALITIVLQDNGGTANGGADTSTAQTFNINVTAVNDAPSFTKGADQTIAEDAGFQFVSNWATNISAGPNEAGQSVFFVVTDNTNPSLFSGTPFISSSGALQYSPASNASGTSTLTVVAKDSNGTANGGQDTSAPQTFTITVTAVNDAPFQVLPPPQTTSQHTPKIFSTATFNNITIVDQDAGTDPIRTTLSATQGTFTLASTSGLTFITGDGTDDASLSFSGTIAAINASLNGMSFKPADGFSGPTSIQIITNDQGFSGAGGALSDTDNLTVNVLSGGTFQFSLAPYTAMENVGTTLVRVVRTLGQSGTATVLLQTSNGTADSSDYTSVSQTLTFVNGQTSQNVSVPITNDSINEPNETVNLTLSNVGGSGSLGSPATAVLTIQDDDAPTVSFALGSYSVSEAGPSVTLSVNRSGDASGPTTVDYSTDDFVAARCDTTPAQASAKCDYATAGGQLRFAPGETTKTIVLSIVDDAFVEGGEQLSVALSNQVGAGLGSPSTTVVTILDNDTNANVPNPFLNNAFFVRQQYLDFLLREPDTQGFNDWNSVLNNCQPNGGFLGSPPGCDRIHVSSGFFRSTEFGEKGYWVYRFYESALGRRPQFAEFMPEMRRLSGLMPDAEQEARRADFISRFMQLPEFTTNFNGLTDAAHATQFIEKLEQIGRVTLPASTTTEPGQPPQYGRQQLITLMSGGQLTAAQTLRAFIEQKVVWDTYFYRAFVAMQYFGYLRRDPEPAGYDDWVRVLTLGDAPTGIQPGDYRHLIFGFVYSVEYRERFGLP